MTNESVQRRVAPYYMDGPRKVNIILTQLRCSASFLNFPKLTLYWILRVFLLNNHNWLTKKIIIDMKLSTCGDLEFSNEPDLLIFKHVQDLTKRSNRFLVPS